MVHAVSLDIANAFKTLSWACIDYCIIVGAYLSERFFIYPSRTDLDRRQMSCGVPQRSDCVLRGAILGGVAVTCHVDDTVVAAFSRTHSEKTLRPPPGLPKSTIEFGGWVSNEFEALFS